MAIEALPEAQTQQYHCERLEYEVSGRMQVPVAAADGVTCFVAKLHAGMQRVCISWIAEKWGEPPYVPHPAIYDADLVFLEGWRSAALPVVDDSIKGRFWKMHGQYLYAAITRPGGGITADPAPSLRTGAMPFDTIRTADDNTIPGTYFRHGIIDGGNVTFNSAIPGP